MSDDIREAPVPILKSPWATAERLRIQQEAREFAASVVTPLANKLDKKKGEFPRSFLDQMGKQGYFGILIDKKYGGMGLGTFEYCMISEELARGWMSAASIIARAQGGGVVGDEKRCEELLRKSAAGQWIGSTALSEPGTGSDLASVATKATRDGDDWVLNGQKRWTGFAKGSDYIRILARTRDPKKGERRAAGMANFVIEKKRGSFPQGITGTLIDKIGYHGFTTWQLTLDNVRVPASHKVEDEGGTAAFKSVQAMLNRARVHTAARAVGLARAAVEDTTTYLQTREQFGEPLSNFQALRFMLAEMAARVEQARSFYHHVAHLIDNGEPAEKESAMVKLLATEMAVEVTGQALQMHGGNGYTTEYSIERYWRDARLTTIFEGTSQIQQRIISDRLLPRGGRV